MLGSSSQRAVSNAAHHKFADLCFSRMKSRLCVLLCVGAYGYISVVFYFLHVSLPSRRINVYIPYDLSPRRVTSILDLDLGLDLECEVPLTPLRACLR